MPIYAYHSLYIGSWQAGRAVWASKIWFSTLRTHPEHPALPTSWVSNMGCCWGVFGVLGDFGLFGVLFGVVLGHFELISGEEADPSSATDFQKRQSTAVKTWPEGESELTPTKGVVLGILKI